jgi:hypothetical protein
MPSKTKTRQSGMTLVEILVVLSIMILLFAAGALAIKGIVRSFESGGSARTLIGAALSSARSLAMRSQHYVGIRFQEDLKGNQYMIPVEHVHSQTGLEFGVGAVTGMKPIKLPESICVLHLAVRSNVSRDVGDEVYADQEDITVSHLEDVTDTVDLGDRVLAGQTQYTRNRNWVDMSTFTVLFSDTSGLVTRQVRARNNQGEVRPQDPNEAGDDVFNSARNLIDFGVGQFLQDDYADYGFGQELSRVWFVICDRRHYESLLTANDKFDYLIQLPRIYVNRYTGTLITQER